MPLMGRVLVADDDEEIRFVVSKVMGRRHDVVEAEDGDAAIAALRAGPFDLVVTDLHMPGHTGKEIVQTAHEEDELLPVIIVTGSGTLQSALECLRAGAYDYILKPFEDLEVISMAAERALQMRAYRLENQRLLEDLRKKNARFETELGIARRVQLCTVPAAIETKGLRVFSRLDPARQVGGDFYDFTRSRATPHQLGFIMGDVVGKGVPAALLMMLAITASREIWRMTSSSGEVLRRLNLQMLESLRQAEALRVDATVSAVALTLDLKTRVLRRAKAGHEDLLCWRARERQIESLAASGLFLGAFESSAYPEETFTLAPGDRVIAFTDGITEARSPKRTLFGLEGLTRSIEEGAALGVHEMGLKILDDVAQFRAGQDPSDDVALVIFELD